MNDAGKTKAELIAELETLRARLRELESAEAEHERTERSLRESEVKYRRIFENANDMIYTHDLEGNFTSANPATVRTYGYPMDEFVRLDISDMVAPEYVPIAMENLGKKLHGITYTEPYELLTLAKDGSHVWVEVSSCLISEAGRPVSVQGILRDITERKRAEEALRRARDELEMRVQERTAELTAANRQLQREIAEHRRTEEALRESERRYRLLAENVTDVIWTTDLDLRFTYISPSTTRLRGHSVREAMAQTLDEMLVPASYKRAIATFEELPPRDRLSEEVDPLQSWTLELEVTRKDGGTVWTEVKTSLLRDSDGCPVGLLGITRDISERKRAEAERAELQEQLHQAQKMEAVGQLSAGIAHDFSNLLAVVLGHADRAKRLTPADSAIAEVLDAIEQAGLQAMDVAKSLLTFSRSVPTARESVNLSALVEDSTRLLRRMLPASIASEVDASCEAPLWVRADSTQLQQVILNLLINARDAMPNGGRLHVSVCQANPDDAIDLPGGADPAPGWARIEVSDTGVGMSPEVRSRVFEPFFTTKQRGQGAGLGLSIVHGIVEDHGGRVGVRSEVGKGSTFAILLPCIEPGAKVASPEAMPAAAPEPTGVILLAEGHRLLREIMVSALRACGYEVVQAGDGSSAIARYEEHRDDVGLLILDQDLPVQRGQDGLDRLRAEAGRIPVIIISAGADAASGTRLGDRTVQLYRPFTMPELCRLVRQVLDVRAGQEGR